MLDLTERKQAEFYLAEGQRLAHMGSWALDPAVPTNSSSPDSFVTGRAITWRCLRTRYEGGETIFEVEPEKEPEVLRRHGYRWRTVRSVSIGLKPVVAV